MLTSMFPKIRDNRIVKAINSFLYTDWYLISVVALMVVANLFAMEFPVYYCYMLFCVATALFADDLFPIMPMTCTSYMTFSKQNNPGIKVELQGGLFASIGNIVQFGIICAAIGILLITRLVFEIRKGREKKAPRLSWGFLVLGIAYLLGGLISPYYEGKTVLYGLLQIVTLCVFYFFFYFTVDWSRRKTDDYAKLFTAIGAGLVLETIGLYLHPEVFQAYESGTFDRKLLFTGWGIYNNVGGMLVLCLPAPFYFAVTKKHGWIFNLLGHVFMLAICLTQSRGSILFGLIMYVGCAVAVLLLTRKRERLYHAITYGAVLLFVGLGSIVCWGKVCELFGDMINKGINPVGRQELYESGLQQFLDYPLFGNGFYQCQYGWDVINKGGFLPARYHNTYVQLLASCGLVGLFAYLCHRVQTVLIAIKRFSLQTMFIGLSIFALCIVSLLDCHFFNLGPGLLYSCLLVLMEKGKTDKKFKIEHRDKKDLKQMQ